MYFVYILESLKTKGKLYVGMTNDIQRRLSEHNAGTQTYTKQHAPWEMRSYTYMENSDKAREYEKYLKSASGRAFMSKHLL